MISAAGIADRALLIDCRSLETASAPLPPETVVVILDTNTRRGLVDSKYNERRAQCEAAARHFGITAHCAIWIMQTFLEREHELENANPQTRAAMSSRENARTLQRPQCHGMRAMPVMLGQLMIASNISLRDDFEVSSPALDAIVDCANAEAACYGARMTGAGFGGCAVALVKAQAAADFAERVRVCYTAATEHEPNIYITSASKGAETVSS